MTQPAKHTPGPWTVHYEPNARDEPGATFVLLEANDRFDTNEANARLIAAAPETAAERDRLKALNAELLAALKEAVLEVNRCRNGDTFDIHVPHRTVDKMLAAIAKAEGK